MNVNYREAISEDISQLSKMRWQFQTESKDVTPVWSEMNFIKSCHGFYSKIINSNEWLFWVAEYEGEIIAHVSVYIVDNIPTPNRLVNKWAYLTNTYTKKSFRGQGLGSKLIKSIIDEAKSMEVETMIVWPSKKSIQFYKREGFDRTTEIMELPIGVKKY